MGDRTPTRTPEQWRKLACASQALAVAKNDANEYRIAADAYLEAGDPGAASRCYKFAEALEHPAGAGVMDLDAPARSIT